MLSELFPDLKHNPNSALRESRMLKLIDSFDWSSTPFGSMGEWQNAFAVTLRTMLGSSIPMALMAGRDGIMFYNDAYIEIAGGRHPSSLGQSVMTAWPEVAAFNRDVIDRVFTGESISFNEQLFLFQRNGAEEEVWLDLDYSPVYDRAAEVIGVLTILSEITKRVKAERALSRTREQFQLALDASGIVGTWDWHVPENRVYSDAHFSQIYNVDVAEGLAGTPIERYLPAIHPDDIGHVQPRLEETMRTGVPFMDEYRVRGTDGKERWILAQGKAILNAQGKCLRFPGIAIDISEQKAAANALQRSETGFRTLANAMPQIVWSARPNGDHDYYNARWSAFTGIQASAAKDDGWSDYVHPDDAEAARKRWAQALKTGEPYQVEYRLKNVADGYRWVLARALPTFDERGDIIRWYGTYTDIHDARQIAAEREIESHELSHRIKNIFSVLSGVIGISARFHPESRDFAADLRQRIDAMGRAHSYMRPRSDLAGADEAATEFFAFVSKVLEPFLLGGDGQRRISLSGDDLVLGDATATPLALLMHELATNASKYGALSQPSGHVILRARLDGDVYQIDWTETGGPKIDTPPDFENGFGSRMIRLNVEGQLGGSIVKVWPQDGLQATIRFPRKALERSNRLQPV